MINLMISSYQNKEDGGSDSEAEQEKLDELDTILKLYDPNFKEYVHLILI